MTLGAPGCETRNLDDYLSRLANPSLGGSGNVWGGKCAPLDPIDFEKRDWIPHSGWPMTREQMRPYYDRACGLLNLPVGPAPESVMGREEPVFNGLNEGSNAFTITPRRYSPVTGAFGTAYDKFKATVIDHARVKVHLNANVIGTNARRRPGRE